MYLEPEYFTITTKSCNNYPPPPPCGPLVAMDTYLFPGGSGVIVLSAAAQARGEKATRLLRLLNALGDLLHAYQRLFTYAKPEQSSREIEIAAERVNSQHVNLVIIFVKKCDFEKEE